MILLADSGSTKTDWRLLMPDGNIKQAATTGLNPNYQDTTAILETLQTELIPQLTGFDPGKIYFYGAGCSTEAKCGIVDQALHQIFPESQINVISDVVAAARGTCGASTGIACILGTGSNSCLFNGEKITDQMPCLGFTLGNEGSGSYLGKQFLTLYLNNELPEDLTTAFQKRYPETPAQILQYVYNEPFPNRYIAGFAKFLFDQRQHPFAANLVHQSFLDFFNRTVCKYPNYENIPTHFVGSIAFYFADILRKAARSKNIQVGRILQSPISGLALYHQQTDLNL